MKNVFIKKLPNNTRFFKKCFIYDIYYNDKFIYYVYTYNNEKVIERKKIEEEEAILLKNI